MQHSNTRARFVRAVISGGLTAASLICGPADTKPAADAHVSLPAQPEAITSGTYRIGAGDILQINVLKEPDASVAGAVVRSDGIISIPVLKDVSVAGLTPKELERMLTQKFSQFIRDPDVTVVVKEIHSEMVYLIGAVRKEGPIALKGPLTVLQAVAQAGGLTDYAKRNRIYILRVENDRQVRMPFDYSAVVKGAQMQQNITLRPGDTIVVPQ